VRTAFTFCVVFLTASGAFPADVFAPLPLGTTGLDEVAAVRVGWRLDGGAEVLRPLGWSGGDEQTGAVVHFVSEAGRPVILNHVPWKNGRGALFVEYALELGKASPIRLDLDVALEARYVGKSDGITFSVLLAEEGSGPFRELARGHEAQGKASPLGVDLSAWAGRKVRLRLQADPGPKRNTGWDNGRFEYPRITVGQGGDVRMTRAGELTATPAYRALAGGELKPLLNRSGAGIVPSARLKHSNTVEALPAEASRGGAVFRYDGPDGRWEFVYVPRTGRLDDVEARVPHGPAYQPCFGGGVALGQGESASEPAQQARLESFDVRDGVARAVWTYAQGGASARVEWTFRMAGKALVIQARSDDTTVCRFDLGMPMASLRREIFVPYLYYARPRYLPAQRAFQMAYVDWTASGATESPGTVSTYLPRLDGRRNALRETAYVAVSADLGEVLPNMPHPPSRYRELLGRKMVLDVWDGNFEQNARLFEQLKRMGVDEVAVILHNWQRYGYDVKLPDHLPANPALGGDEKLKPLADTARRLGYVFSVHENYIDFYPDAPSYNPADVVLNRAGEKQKAWYQPGTGVQSFAFKSHRALHYAAQNTPEIHKRFGTTAAYLDVNTCVPPWRYVDFDAAQQAGPSHAFRQAGERALFKYLQDTHEGPLLGEGHHHFFWAGLVDGVEAQVENGRNAPLLLDFDLLKLHPQMVNHGMGYYNRWMGDRRAPWPTPTLLDQYRAQQLAYAHASFSWGHLRAHMPTIAREYHLSQPIAARYATASPVEIAYELDGKMVNGSAAAVAGRFDRVRVRYDSGLTLWANFAEADWTVDGCALPQYGFLADGAGVRAWTGRRGQTIADFARTADGLYADARTEIFRPWAGDYKDIEPRLKAFRDAGGGHVELTYEWRVAAALDEDLYTFVHFCPAGVRDEDEDSERDRIAFQGDHRPAKATSTWRPGMTLSDGPHRVRVPAGERDEKYDILIGLHGRHGRISLNAVESDGRRYVIGRLAVTRRDGKVEKVELTDYDDLRQTDRARRGAYLARMNEAGRKVDFGPVATDGAFKLLIRKDALELIPLADRPFEVELDLAELTGRNNLREQTSAEALVAVKVQAVDDAGKPQADVPAKPLPNRPGWIAFKASTPRAMRYMIR